VPLVPLKAAAGWSIVNAALLAQDVALVASKVSIAGILTREALKAIQPISDR